MWDKKVRTVKSKENRPQCCFYRHATPTAYKPNKSMPREDQSLCVHPSNHGLLVFLYFALCFVLCCFLFSHLRLVLGLNSVVCNNPLHVRMQGVGVWSCICMYAFSADRLGGERTPRQHGILTRSSTRSLDVFEGGTNLTKSTGKKEVKLLHDVQIAIFFVFRWHVAVTKHKPVVYKEQVGQGILIIIIEILDPVSSFFPSTWIKSMSNFLDAQVSSLSVPCLRYWTFYWRLVLCVLWSRRVASPSWPILILPTRHKTWSLSCFYSAHCICLRRAPSASTACLTVACHFGQYRCGEGQGTRRTRCCLCRG